MPVLVGAIGGSLTGIGQALIVDSPSNALLLGLFDGAAGGILGTVIMAVGLVAAAIARSPAGAAALSIPIALLISAAGAIILTYGWLLWPAVATGAAAASAHIVRASARARHRPPVVGTHERSDAVRDGLLPRIGVLAGGVMLAIVLAPLALSTIRDGIHYACSYGTRGEASGSWMCADGIGYLLPGAALLAAALLPALIGVLVILAATAGAAERTLRVLSFAPVAATAAMTAALTLGRDDPLPPGQTWQGVWLLSVGLSAALAFLGNALLVWALHTRTGGAVSKAAGAAGGALMLASAVVQPGMAFVVAAGAACIAASAVRTGLPAFIRHPTTAATES